MRQISINTTISCHKTVGEILSSLANAGATRIEVAYDNSLPVRISFMCVTAYDVEMRFVIESQHDEIYQRMWSPASARTSPILKQKIRVAWQHHQNWIESQCEMIKSGAIPFERAMVSYLVGKDGRWVCEALFDKDKNSVLKIETNV
jgi:hypothetical protein